MFDEEVKVNSNGVNAEIKAYVLSPEEMEKIGFVDCGNKWYFCRGIYFPQKNIKK